MDRFRLHWRLLARSATQPERGHGAPATTRSRRAGYSANGLLAGAGRDDGAVGAVWAPGGKPRIVFDFTIAAGKIVEIALLADPERLRRPDLAVLDS